MPKMSMADLRRHGDQHRRKKVPVLNSEMSYVDVGQGRPIVFLHGNPTWSYVWRNIIPYALPYGRCLAPDLIGMGLSGRSSSGSYRFADHARYLDAWFDALGLDQEVMLVSHDWGTAFAADWANRHRSRVAGFVHMEGVIRPSAWSEHPAWYRDAVLALRSPDGRRLVMEENFLIETMLPKTVMQALSSRTMEGYRAPYRHPDDREAMFAMAADVPVNGHPPEITAVLSASSAWLSSAIVPKLLVIGSPGGTLVGDVLSYARRWLFQQEVWVTGTSLLQEDAPHDIGRALSMFLQTFMT